MQGVAYWIQSATDSHFMTAETVVELYENLYAPAFKLQRHAHGLQLANRGMLICDGFTGCHADTSGVDDRRRRWADQNNVHLPEPQPGGWSSKGQPCDKLFGIYKARVKVAMDRSIGFGTDFWNRPKYHELPLSTSGAPRRSIDLEQAHIVSVQVWRQLPASFFQGAWIACGYVTAEDMAQMNGMDPAGLEQELSHNCGMYSTWILYKP